jgi:SAM-dependent methyltransferase
MSTYHYVGSELELFREATVWKSYFRRHVEPYIRGDVLEVGAGMGGTTKLLCRARQGHWICLEPDGTLAESLRQAIEGGELPRCCQVITGALDRLPPTALFDTLLYIDVLEHIEDDRGELERAAAYLRPGGHLVVLAPAHPWLFSPFDRSIGHYRRYTRPSLGALTPGGLVLVRSIYLDSIGLLASLGNRLFLRQAMPGPGQIALWDKVLVRCSRCVDPIVGYSLGKSVLCIWSRPALSRRSPSEQPQERVPELAEPALDHDNDERRAPAQRTSSRPELA